MSESDAEPEGVGGWVAVAYGALDVHECDQFTDETELIVVPIKPTEPLALPSIGAALWRKLVNGPVSDDALDEEERAVVREMADAGLASADLGHPARVRAVDKPWLSSPMHELVYALVASVARENEIPLIVIKGPVLHRQGLREREHSGDVDIWVAPDRVRQLAAALRAWGWSEVPDVWSHTEINHSISLEPRAGWGCEIDIHRRMPGIGLPDVDAFATVLRNSEANTFAGVEARAPVTSANAILAALHMLRPEIGARVRPSSRDEAVHLISVGGGRCARQRPGHGCYGSSGRRARSRVPRCDL